MSVHEQKAQELAERCAESIADQSLRQWGALPPNPIEELSFIILRELNLAKLLEDAAMLDWLSKDWEIVYNLSLEIEPGSDIRTAIRNAMKEDEE